jgi:hypothetical protein
VHEVFVRLHPEVKVSVSLNIALSEEEARTQLAKQAAPAQEEAPAAEAPSTEEAQA